MDLIHAQLLDFICKEEEENQRHNAKEIKANQAKMQLIMVVGRKSEITDLIQVFWTSPARKKKKRIKREHQCNKKWKHALIHGCWNSEEKVKLFLESWLERHGLEFRTKWCETDAKMEVEDNMKFKILVVVHVLA